MVLVICELDEQEPDLLLRDTPSSLTLSDAHRPLPLVRAYSSPKRRTATENEFPTLRGGSLGLGAFSCTEAVSVQSSSLR
mmetsp:Transcript_4511/g.6890  ORF Transcript_4511/g.6890 Transcript_4511/m.6890 type:complete len:80 (+) Transcript_4511:392-631(+)